MNANILIVNSEHIQAETLSLGLFVFGHNCICVDNNKDAFQVLNVKAKDKIDLVLADISNPGWSGLELIRQIRLERPEVPMVVITGLKAPFAVNAAREMGITILSKPFNPQKLNRIIQELVHKA